MYIVHRMPIIPIKLNMAFAIIVVVDDLPHEKLFHVLLQVH